MLTDQPVEFDTVYHLRNPSVADARSPGARLLLGLGAVVYHALSNGHDVVIHHGDISERIDLPDAKLPPTVADDQVIIRWHTLG